MPLQKDFPKPLENKKRSSNLVYLIVLALILAAIYLNFTPKTPSAEKVALNSFIEEVEKGQVEKIQVKDNKILFTLQDGTEKYTIKESEGTLNELLKEIPKETLTAVEIEIIDTEATSLWTEILVGIIPFALIIGFFIFMFRQAQSSSNQALSFGRSRPRLFDKTKQKTTFNDVAGCKEAKEELIEIVDFLKNPAKYTAIGAKIPKGVLLVGQTGTGKTLLARAVAGEANVPFFSVAGSEFMEMFVGVGASVTGDTPVLIKKEGQTQLLPISALVDPYYPENGEGYLIPVQNIQTLGYTSAQTGFRGCSRGSASQFFGESSFKNVKGVYRHRANQIYEIHYQGRLIRVTGNHSIFIRKHNVIKVKKASELKKGDILVNLPFKVRSSFIPGLGTTHKVKAHFFPEEIPLKELTVWEEDQETVKSYALATEMAGFLSQKTLARAIGVSEATIGNWQRGIHQPRAISSNYTLTPIPQKVALTPKLLKLFGFYLAEGRENGNLEFVFGIQENKFHQECISLMNEVFNLKPNLEKTPDNTLRIKYYSAPLGRFFGQHCGNGSHNKHLPDFLWDLPPLYFFAFLEGYFKGDGYTTKEGKLAITSVSKQLITELAWLLAMHGIQVGVRQGEYKPGRLIKNKPLPGGKYWTLIIGKTSHPFRERTKSPYQFKKTKVQKIVIREYNGYVYDLCGCENEAFFGGEKPVLLHNSRVRDLFRKAKRNAPAIIFIDEIDAVGRHRGAGLGGGHDEREQTLNQILTEMDGFEQDTRIVILAATNRPDILDPALLRPGRFDRRIVVDLPDIKAREEILKVHTRGKNMVKNVDLSKIARQTPGFSGADLENLMNEAAILAAKLNKKQIGMSEIEKSIEKVLMGPERKSRILSKEEKKITAYHECGHALVAHFQPHCDPVHKVSIVSRGLTLGATWFIPKEDKHLYSKSKFEDELASLLGGYAAEELIFGEITTGSSNDLEQASQIARRMVTEYGMSKLGPIIYGEKQQEIFLGRDFGRIKNYSEEIASKIDQETDELVKKAHLKARSILTKNRKKLDQLALTLIEKETLTREEFLSFFKGKEKTPPKIKRRKIS